MKKFLIPSVVALVLGVQQPVLAQIEQSSGDDLARDTIDMVFSVLPDAASGQLNVQMDMYFFNDGDTIVGGVVGFVWDNPNLRMDSTVIAPDIQSELDFFRITLYGNDIDSTNAYRRFLFGGLRMSGTGIVAAPVRRLWASYFFTLTEWSESDSVVIDTLQYNEATRYVFFDNEDGVVYPHWAGPYVVRDTPSSCCNGVTGNVDCSADEIVDIGDVNEMIRLLFLVPGAIPCCFEEADLDYNGVLDIGDLSILQTHLFITLEPFDPCP